MSLYQVQESVHKRTAGTTAYPYDHNNTLWQDKENFAKHDPVAPYPAGY